MFHLRTGLITAIATLLTLTVIPNQAYANGPAQPIAVTQIEASSIAQTPKVASVKHMSFDDFRFETRSKLTQTRQWVKEKKRQHNYHGYMNDLERSVDGLQNKAAPLRSAIKSSFKSKTPGLGLVHLGDRTVSMYGMILMMAFAFVLLLMSLSTPSSRLGGRH